MSSLVVILLFVVAALASSVAFAHNGKVLSSGFQVCMRNIPNITYEPKEGIDAVEGKIKSKNATISFMIGRHPNLPPAMGVAPDKTNRISRQLSDDLRLIAKSVGSLGMGAGGPLGVGTEQLYAFNKMSEDGSPGHIQDQIFVQLWTDTDRQNVHLLKKVGGALYRCH